MLHGILVFYVAAIVSRKPKSTFKISCAQNVPKIVFFTQKWRQKRLLSEMLGSLIFQWQRGWDSNPRWLITTLDFDFVVRIFRTQMLCGIADL